MKQNNETEDMMKVIRSLENEIIQLKKTKAKLLVKKEDFLTAGLTLIKNVLTLLAKSALKPLRLIATASATDADIPKKIYISETTALIISNEEMYDIMKTVKSLKESSLLMKVFSEKIKNEAKNK